MEQLERDIAKVNKRLPKTTNNIRKTGRAAATASGNIQRLGIAFRTTLAPIVAITGGLALLNKALNTVGERGAALDVLRSGLVGLVDDAGAAADELLNVADRLGKATLFDEEDFTAQFKLLTSFRNIGVDAYERVATAAADIATKIGSGPKEAVLQLAKALEDPAKRVTDLSRAGTVFTEQQKEQIKALQESGDLLGAQELVLKEIEKQYGGAAKAAGSAGFAGALDSLGESWRDLLEQFGKSSESDAVNLLNGVAKGLDFVKENFDILSETAGSVVDVFKEPFVALFEGIESVTGPVDGFRENFRGTLAVISKLLTDLTQNVITPVFKFAGKVIGQVGRLVAGLAAQIAKIVPEIVTTITGALRTLAAAFARFINATPIGLLTKLFGIDSGQLVTAPLRAFANGVDNLASSVGNYGDELRAAADAANLPGASAVTGGNPFAGAGPRGANPKPGDIVGGEAFNGPRSSSASKGLDFRDAERFEQLIKDRERAAAGLLRTALDNQAILKEDNELEKIKLRGMIEVQNIAIKYGQEAEKVVSARERELLVLSQAAEVQNSQTRTTQELNAELERIAANEEKIVGPWEQLAAEAIPQVGQAIQESIVTAIDAAVTGTKDLGEELRNIASSLLRSLGGLFINAGLNGIGGALNLPTFASGGVLPSNGPAIVGEAGPELAFSNGGRTTIVPMDAFADARAAMGGGLSSSAGAADDTTLFGGGDSMYNSSTANNAFADNRSSISNTRSVYQSSAEQTSYQEAVSAVMGSSGSMVIETQVINGIEYATVGELQAATAAATKAARAEVFAEMKSNPGLRRKVGLK